MSETEMLPFFDKKVTHSETVEIPKAKHELSLCQNSSPQKLAKLSNKFKQKMIQTGIDQMRIALSRLQSSDLDVYDSRIGRLVDEVEEIMQSVRKLTSHSKSNYSSSDESKSQRLKIFFLT